MNTGDCVIVHCNYVLWVLLHNELYSASVGVLGINY